MIKIRTLVATWLLLSSSNIVHAKLIQILHTNDTHSFLDGGTQNPRVGGLARLKSLIDFYKNKGNEEGISTLTLDAGDFSEGNIFYMAEKGRKTFLAHDKMGYDVGALGNHDYLMGTKELDQILGDLDYELPMVAANLKVPLIFKNIREKIKPFHELEIDGIKFGILGLTTHEIFYSWRLEGGRITNPYKAAKHYEKILKERGNDFIIGLTHIGVSKDMRLVEQTSNIDLVVGGHSHTALFEPVIVPNKKNRMVPIVQAGMHTEYLGRIVVDVNVGQPLKVVSYELVPVKYEEKDTTMNAIVEEASNDLESHYGKDWLYKKIGKSDLEENDSLGMRKWAYFITDTIKEKSNADIGIHVPPMNGENYPIGDITRKDLINSMPRVFDLDEKYGWNIYTSKIKGIWLKLTFEALTHFGQPLTFSGMKMEYRRTKYGIKIKTITVNGKPINPFKTYTVAFTEGIIKGAAGISPYTFKLLQHPHRTPYKIWASLEEKLGHNNKSHKLGLLNSTIEHEYYSPDEKALVDLE